MAERTIPLRMSDFSGPAPNVEKCQCWLCANEKAALTTEVERLRTALRGIIADSFSVYAIQVARAALEEGL